MGWLCLGRQFPSPPWAGGGLFWPRGVAPYWRGYDSHVTDPTGSWGNRQPAARPRSGRTAPWELGWSGSYRRSAPCTWGLAACGEGPRARRGVLAGARGGWRAPARGRTSTAHPPDRPTEAQRPGTICPRSRPSNVSRPGRPCLGRAEVLGAARERRRVAPALAGRSATHVVLAGDEALLKAQEGDVADEGVPHGGAVRGFTSLGAPSWALKGLERGSHCCCGRAGAGGVRRAQKGPRKGFLLSLSGTH